MSMTVSSENDIKTYLIDFLRNQSANSKAIYGVEVSCLLGSRRVDILKLCDNDFHAYEIKSDKDNLKRLPGQFNDYSSIFDYTTVVLTKKHYSYVKKNKAIITGKIGILLYDGKKVKKIRKAKRNTALQKNRLCYFLNRADLSKIVLGFDKSMEMSELRKMAIKTISDQEIKRSAYHSLFNRYKERHEAFKSDVGKYTLIDDLKILSRKLTL